MNKHLIEFALGNVLIASAAAADIDYSEVARCAFVYAPLYEAASAQADETLRQYSLQRLMYIRGVVEANRANSRFVAVFDNDLKVNKAAGMKLEDDLKRAYRSGDIPLYNSTLRAAEVCDANLKLSTLRPAGSSDRKPK